MIHIIYMAAGNSRRFGSNKLFYELNGKPMYRHLLERLIEIKDRYNKLKNASIELILYNDSPDEEVNLSEIKTDYQLKLIQPKYNRGIHAARVEGLKNANGTYVLFLDQDDIIHEDYLYSQLNGIGDNDAIVCRLENNNKQHYNDSFVFEKVVSKEFMINKWCSIVSPGQVLIRRQSIPQIWEDNLLSNNGADDYFLWILMFMQGNKFALNQNILFKHVLNGSNTSSDTNKMMDSELEMLGILHDNHILDDEQMYGKLLTRFSARYLEPVKECEAWIPIEDEAAVAGKFGVKVMHDASDGGIFGALWDMALGTHRGFRVDLKAIPFRQEIVEISTYLGLNPYRMKSSGCFIAVTPDGAGLVEAMRREGMPACIIG